MTFKAAEFEKFCIKIEGDADYVAFIEAHLPNDGETAKAISAHGLEAYLQFGKSMVDDMKDCK